MSPDRPTAGALAVFALLLLRFQAVALAQVPVPVGNELAVNAYTSGEQTRPAIGMSGSGSFVVVWSSADQDGSVAGVFARRFSSSGGGLGAEFAVNTYTSGAQDYPAIDVNAAGAFVISWEGEGQDGSSGGVFARRFSSAGVAQGIAFLVNSYTTGGQRFPSAAIDPSGSFVIAWQSSHDGSGTGVFARRFDASGLALASEFQVNTTTASAQESPNVDLEPDGDFVVVWGSTQAPSGGVFAQRFDSAGVRRGVEFEVDIPASTNQFFPKVGVDADGDFVVVWYNSYPVGGGFAAWARPFSSSGTPLESPFHPNTDTTTASPTFPRVAVDASGDFVVAWEHDARAFARRFNASGLAQRLHFEVSSLTAYNARTPAVAGDADGDFVIAWSTGASDEHDIVARRFDVSSSMDVDGNGSIEPLSDGLLVLRYQFGFTGATLITGAVGPGCTRCDAGSILSYLQSIL